LWVVSPTTIDSFELPNRAEIERATQSMRELLSGDSRAIRDYADERELGLSKEGSKQDQEPNNQRMLERASPTIKEFYEAATVLSKMVLAPAANLLGAKRLLIVADDALQLIPFSTLPAPTAQSGSQNSFTPLIIEHEITYLPSASTLAVLRAEIKDRKPGDKALFVLADPVFDKDDPRINQNNKTVNETIAAKSDHQVAARGLERVHETAVKSAADEGLKIHRLPFTRREAEGISELLPNNESMRAFDFEANRATLASAELSRYRIVHIATHGFFNFVNPSLSGLVLSLVDKQGAPADGFLLAPEIYNLNIPAELVILSACETGLGKQIRGEGMVGVTRGFMYAARRASW